MHDLIQAKSLVYTIRQQHPIPKEKPVVLKREEPAVIEEAIKPTLFEINIEWVNDHRATTAIAAAIVSSSVWYSPIIIGSIVFSAASLYAYQANESLMFLLVFRNEKEFSQLVGEHF